MHKDCESLQNHTVKFPLNLDDSGYDDMKEELRQIRKHYNYMINPPAWVDIDLEEGDMKNKLAEIQESFRSPMRNTTVVNVKSYEDDACVCQDPASDEDILDDVPLLKESINTTSRRGENMHEWRKKHICKYRSADCCHCTIS